MMLTFSNYIKVIMTYKNSPSTYENYKPRTINGMSGIKVTILHYLYFAIVSYDNKNICKKYVPHIQEKSNLVS